VSNLFASGDSLLNFYAQSYEGARPVTKPLAGRAGARIVGTIGGTAHRPHHIYSVGE